MTPPHPQPGADPLISENESRALVLAPLGRDSAIAVALLRQAALSAQACRDLPEILRELDVGAGCLVVTQEAIQTADLHPLSAWLQAQPAWSDLPIIIIAERGDGPKQNPGALRLSAALGNVSFLERPFRPLTLLSHVQSALRSRRHQFHARAQLAELAAREHSLRDSEARFRTLADNIPVLAWTADADGAVAWYNPRWYQYTGKTPEELLGHGWETVIDPETLPAVTQTWRNAVQTGTPMQMVFPIRGADGVLRPFLTQVVPVLEAGRIVRWFGSNVDISSERAAETAVRTSEDQLRRMNETLEQLVADRTARLQANEARLRTVFESTYQAQFLLETDGTLIEANTTALDLIAASLHDVVGLHFCQTPWFATTSGMTDILRTAIEAAAAGADVRREITLDLSGAPRTFDFSLRPVRDPDGQIVAIVPQATELTSARQVEEALRQAQKMEAVGQLTGGIAHDFNNMLQSIASAIELMRRRIKAGNPEQADRYVDAAQQGIDRAAALVHRLLAFSRRQALAPKRVDPDELVGGMADLVRQTVGPAIAVHVHLADGAWPVECDPNQLESALLNLAINARDAMTPGGGRLDIVTRHVQLAEADVAGWQTAQPGAYVRVSVRDTGTGMSPDIIQHVFEPFFTTKPAGQGTGLGLSQVFGFVTQSNGAVGIDSTPGAGTEISLFLPRHRETAALHPPTRSPATPSAPPTSATILLVDDETDIRRFAAEALTDFGCTVLEAKDGPAALHILRDLAAHPGTHIDLLVSDVGLPGGLNGRQLADAARAVIPGLPVLLITGYAGDALGTGVEDGAHIELLTKPFTIASLSDRVERLLTGPRPAMVPLS